MAAWEEALEELLSTEAPRYLYASPELSRLGRAASAGLYASLWPYWSPCFCPSRPPARRRGLQRQADMVANRPPRLPSPFLPPPPPHPPFQGCSSSPHQDRGEGGPCHLRSTSVRGDDGHCPTRRWRERPWRRRTLTMLRMTERKRKRITMMMRMNKMVASVLEMLVMIVMKMQIQAKNAMYEDFFGSKKQMRNKQRYTHKKTKGFLERTSLDGSEYLEMDEEERDDKHADM